METKQILFTLLFIPGSVCLVAAVKVWPQLRRVYLCLFFLGTMRIIDINYVSREVYRGWVRGFEIDDSWHQAESEFVAWDLSLLSADLFHRQWVRRILERSGDSHDLGEDLLLDGNECRFGHWLNGPGSAAWGHLEAFRDIVSIHSKLHEVAQRLLIDAVGDDASALAEEKEQLLVLQEKLSDKFKQLQRALVPD